MAESSRANRNRKCAEPPVERGGGLKHEMAESSLANQEESYPEHDIFLSHSGKQKPFVEQLFHDFLSAGKHPFYDQDSHSLPKAEPFPQNIVDAAQRCKMGVVVLSEDYLKSYWPMVELNLFVESNVRLYPLFFKLKPSDLKHDEVESTLKPAWRDMGMKEEVVESWGKAVKALRISNGLEFAKYSNSEHKYRLDVVRDICKQLPPILKSMITHIQGYERLCKMTLSMFEGNQYLGLYGMAGAGKSTLCKAMCNYNQGEFGANVYRVELTFDQPIEHLAEIERLTRLKHVLKLMGVDKGILKRILSEGEGWEQWRKTLKNLKIPIFLAIDNVGNSGSSRKEAQSYLEAGLPVGSKVLVTSRSRDILEDVLDCRGDCKPLPRLEQDEALQLFLSIAAPKKSSSSLNGEEKEIVERCVSECRYVDSGYTSTQFHPLVLKALGSYFFCKDKFEVLNWKKDMDNNDKLQRSEDAENLNIVLGLNYERLSKEMKMIYLDTVLYPHDGYSCLPWWTPGTRSSYDAWVLWISEVHKMSTSDARTALEQLQQQSLFEDSSLSSEEYEKPYTHDLYKDFVKSRVESEGSMEWKWWMSQEEVDMGKELKLQRLLFRGDKSMIGEPPKKLQDWRSLVFLELFACNDFGVDSVLDIGGLNKLRVLVVEKCTTVRKIICTCNNDKGNPEKCGHRNGCMKDLYSVKLAVLDSLNDVSFLRHCPNIEILRVLYCNGSIYPSESSYIDNPHALDVSHLKMLHTLIVWEDMKGIDNTFSKWLCNTLQLEMLTALEYAFIKIPTWVRRAETTLEFGGKKNYGAITIDLSEGVSSSKLSILSMRLPAEVEKIQGLQFLSNLTTLNLNECPGVQTLTDLKNLTKLKEVCFGGRHSPQSLAEILPPHTRTYIESTYHEYHDFSTDSLKELFPCVFCDVARQKCSQESLELSEPFGFEWLDFVDPDSPESLDMAIRLMQLHFLSAAMTFA